MLKLLKRVSSNVTFATSFALLLSAANCTPPDDDDDSTPMEGNVRCVGGAAFETIQEAIDACPEGSSIVVNPGIYDEDLDINKALSISGPAREQVLVTGGGSGTIVEIDQVDGLVQITGISFQAPYDELNTIRGFRITESANVLLHDLFIGFASSEEGTCDHGLVGVELSQSTATLSDSDIICVGFTSGNGGTGVLAQTNSSLEVSGTLINGVGSFGIRVIDSSLSVDDTELSGINRPSGAESFESDGTAIYVEQATEEILVSNTTVSNGSFVGLWIEGPGVAVTDSSFANFAYGVYHPGDPASAAGRHTTVTGSTFLDLANEAILTFASATISGNTIGTKKLVPDALASPDVAGIRVVAPGGTVSITTNTIDTVGQRGIGIYGNNSDGKIETATIEGNVLTNIIGGNGIDVHHVISAEVLDNTVTGVDHAYFDDDGGPNAGATVNGYGIDCFYSTLCALSNNIVSGSEFANIVFVNSGFSMTGDQLSLGSRAGVHIQSSQGTLDGVNISDTAGFGLYAFDATLQMTGVNVSQVQRGPNVSDIDGVDDPLPEELTYFYGGIGVYVTTQGAPSFLSFAGGTVSDCVSTGLHTNGIQLELTDSVFTNIGFEDESGFSADSALQIYSVDELATNGPLITGNVFDGGDGYQGIYLNDVPGLVFSDNTVCLGSSSALYLRNPSGGTISDNRFGLSDGVAQTCGSQDWSQSVYVSFSEEAAAEGGLTLSGNTIAGSHSFGLYLNGTGDLSLEGNTISGATSAGIFASAGLATGLTSDADGDGLAEYNGDCDDTDPSIGGATAVEVPDDGIDNDCDGVTDNGTNTDDADGDGLSIADGDCDDNDSSIFPGQVEIVGNYFDDNCDGWADFDGDMPRPTLTLTDNTIDSCNIGINSYGAGVELTAPGTTGIGNVISDSTEEAILVRSWSWGTSPALTPGTLSVASGNTLGPSTGECIWLDGEAVAATLEAATLAECGTFGVSQTGNGTVSLVGTTISEAGTAALNLTEGVMSVSGGAIISGPSEIGLRMTDGVATVDGLMISSSVTRGVALTGGDLTLETAEISGSSISGISMDGGILNGGTGLSVSGSGAYGLSATSGTLSLNGSTVSDNDVVGISLSGNVTAGLSSVTLEGNDDYGLVCDGGSADSSSSTVTLDPCDLLASGNLLGPYSLENGCELDWSCTTN